METHTKRLFSLVQDRYNRSKKRVNRLMNDHLHRSGGTLGELPTERSGELLPSATAVSAAADDPYAGTLLGRRALSATPLQIPTIPFEIRFSMNPLIAACSSIFVLTNDIRQQVTLPPLTELRQLLCQEVRAFEIRAHRLQYRAPIILAARYFLCVFADETILQTSWGPVSQWESHSLLRFFQGEEYGGERFFTILERCSEDPKTHLDLMELGYLCLSLGFRGKFSHANHYHALGQFIDQLYYLIQDTRGNASRSLLAGPTSLQISLPIPQRLRRAWLWSTAISTVILLLAIYLPYRWHLATLSAPIYHTLSAIAAEHG